MKNDMTPISEKPSLFWDCKGLISAMTLELKARKMKHPLPDDFPHMPNGSFLIW
jgi:hypothetical protein